MDDLNKIDNKKKRKWVIIIGSLLLGLSGLLIGVDHWLPYMLLSHYKFSVNPQPEILLSQGITPEEITFKTSDEINMSGWFIAPGSESRNKEVTIIVLHTLGRTREDMLEFCLPFREKGYNLALIDLRGHGESGGKYFTYGFHEKKDIRELIDYLREEKPESMKKIVLLGVSAGGAVAIQTAALDFRIDALVSIASFSDLKDIVRHQVSWLPDFWRNRALSKAEGLAGFKVEETSPLKSIEGIKCPVFLAHGTTDNYIPYSSVKLLYEKAPYPKELYEIEDANHASMFGKGGDDLKNSIDAFLQKNLLRNKKSEKIDNPEITDEDVIRTLNKSQGEYWYGIYMGKTKIGCFMEGR